MIRYIELIEPFDQNGYVPNSVMASSPNGDWVLYSEAQAEIDALKAQRDALLAAQEGTPCKHKFNAVVGGVLSCTHCYASFSDQQAAIAKARVIYDHLP